MAVRRLSAAILPLFSFCSQDFKRAAIEFGCFAGFISSNGSRCKHTP